MTRLLPLNGDNSAPVQAPIPGDVLGGKYRVEREIGSGGMGIVYEVTHLVMTKKRFAVKWLLPLPDGYQGEDAQAAARRFVREAEIAGGIKHPNVVDVYDVTIGDSGCFMVMELLEGESLEARLKREGRLPVGEACRIIAACASGIAAAHAASVIHRDLKPANIFLTRISEVEPSRPKVLDFGISRFTAPEGSVQSTVTRAGTLIGTPMYMAPEQLRGFECDARTDVYGLGASLYEALSGERAFNAPTHADLVVRILTGDVKELRQLDSTIPAGLSAIVMRALHCHPEQRFASVQALLDALQPYAAWSGSAASLNAAGAKPRRRAAIWALGLALGAIALTLGFIATRWQGPHSPRTVAPTLVLPAQLPSSAHATQLAPEEPTPQVPVGKSGPPPAATERPPTAVNVNASPERRAAQSETTSPKRRPSKRAGPAAAQPTPQTSEPEPPARTPKPRPSLNSL